MSVLPTGRPLRQVIPEYEELLRDPAAYLRGGPVVIGPRQMYGVAVTARQFRLTAANEGVLPARYEARADELGALLLHLGGRLGGSLPKGSPPPEAYPAEDFDAAAVPEPDDAGWFTVHLTHLAFPPHRCCSCLADADDLLRVHVDARGDWFLHLF